MKKDIAKIVVTVATVTPQAAQQKLVLVCLIRLNHAAVKNVIAAIRMELN